MGNRYPWASPEVVLNMTPAQVAIYAKDAGAGMNPMMMLMGALMGGSPGGGGTSEPGTDARFPGKKIQRFKNMTEASKYIRS